MKKIIAAFLFLLSFVMNAQAPKKFYTRFGGYGHDIGYGVVQTLNGQYAVTGSTSSFGNGNTDVYLALVDSMGWVRWEKSYGGFNNDIGRSIIQLKDSGFVIAGYTNSFGSGGYDVFAVRTDKNGNLIWQKAFGGFDWDFGYCVKESNGGDSLIICGNTYSFGYGKSDGYIIKTDINGNFQWQKTYGGAEDDEFKSFTLTYNNQYAFAGTTKSMGDTKGDCWLMKTNLGGDSLLGVKYGDNKIQFLNDIYEHPITKDFYFAGGYDKDGLDSTAAILLCLDQNGNFQFNDIYSYHERKDEQFYALTYSKANDFLYLRRSNNSKFDLRFEAMISQYSNNVYVSTTKYGSSENDELFDIVKTRDKGFVCIGYTTSFSAKLTDVFLVKIDSLTLTGAVNLVGISEVLNSDTPSFEVYPTVTEQKFFVNCPDIIQKNLKLEIRNSTGNLINEKLLVSGLNEFDLLNHSDGIYFILIRINEKTLLYKIIKTQ